MSNTVNIEIVNFKKELKRVEEEINRLGNIEIEERLDYSLNTLQIVTPVDTGKARAGWKLTKLKNKEKLVEGILENPVDYISELNKGHSRQAPRYFIEQVLSKIGLLTPS